METRVCRKCGEEKELTKNFKQRKRANGILRSWGCKKCLSEYDKIRRKNNPEKANSYYKDNKDIIKQRVKFKIEKDAESYRKNRRNVQKKYRANNQDKIKKYNAEYLLNNREIRREKSKIYRIKVKQNKVKKEPPVRRTKIEKLESRRLWLSKNTERQSFLKRERYKKLDKSKRQEISKKSVTYILKRRNTNPLFKMKCNLRKRTWAAFKAKGYKKGCVTELLLGCAFDAIKSHIESLFQPWMTWANYGEWVIDHKIPLAKAKNEEELIKLCHYTNLQPLLKSHNMAKGAKLDYVIPSSDPHYCRIQRPD